MKPTEDLKKEHEAPKLMLRIMEEVSEGLGAGEKVGASLLSRHIEKEDHILYPMADGRLSATAQRELEKGFEKTETEVIGPGRHEEFHGLLHRLKEEYLNQS